MINAIISKFFGTAHERYLKQFDSIISQVEKHGEGYAILDDKDLVAKTEEFKKRLEEGESLNDLRSEAFAVCREAGDRRLGIFNIFKPHLEFDFSKLSSEGQSLAKDAAAQLEAGAPEWELMLPGSFYEEVRSLYPNSVRPFRMRSFNVQLIGGLVLHGGAIGEMATGEGKTLAAACPVYLNALSGKGVHVVTVNDYLASRDAEMMGMAYKFLGLSVGLIVANMETSARRLSYGSDVTYGTNNEFGFDYLRDNMAVDKEELVQRELNFCIVDEVDSVLIDEARTPLIISGPAADSTDRYGIANSVVPQINIEEHFTVDEKSNSVLLTDAGVQEVERLLKIDNLYSPENSMWVHHMSQALRANHLFANDVDYVVERGEVVIIDENTGRKMEGRRYSDGLHQALEAKEGVQIRRESQTLASITFQNFFKMYNTLSGMTGTADTEAAEFNQIYNLPVVVLPTHRPLIRDDMSDQIYRTEVEKLDAIMYEIKERHQKGQPLLVGTISIEKSELLADRMQKEGFKFEVLNAKNHGREAEIIKMAGHLGRITISTNMAGRGTDIVLGEGVAEVGGLHVLATERHESRRIDNQLRGRAGRQGDAGSSQYFLSLDDNLMRIFGGDRIKGIMDKMGATEGEVIAHGLVNRAIANAQKRVEGQNFEARKHLLEYDSIMNEQRKVVYGLRRSILNGQDLKEEVQERFEEALDQVVSIYTPPGTYPEEWKMDKLSQEMKRRYGVDFEMRKQENLLTPSVILEQAIETINKKYLTLEEKVDSENIRNLERRVMLMTMDQAYKEHLYAMDHLKDSIKFSGYAQKDPLMLYKKEAFVLFEQRLDQIAMVVTERLLNVRVEAPSEEVQKKRLAAVQTEAEPTTSVAQLAPVQLNIPKIQAATAGNGVQYSNSDPLAKSRPKQASSGPKVGRNDPCWCGSGKKFKKCHGA
tara:strand:+ start:560 stop:3358 length:2799 start_codon:yes stop_codon:yes gene_type:complete